MEVDKGNRNCYNCGGFRHLTRNCRNRGAESRIGKGRRLKYENNEQRKMIEGKNKQSNLNEDRDLIVLD